MIVGLRMSSFFGSSGNESMTWSPSVTVTCCVSDCAIAARCDTFATFEDPSERLLVESLCVFRQPERVAERDVLPAGEVRDASQRRVADPPARSLRRSLQNRVTDL